MNVSTLYYRAQSKEEEKTASQGKDGLGKQKAYYQGCRQKQEMDIK